MNLRIRQNDNLGVPASIGICFELRGKCGAADKVTVRRGLVDGRVDDILIVGRARGDVTNDEIGKGAQSARVTLGRATGNDQVRVGAGCGVDCAAGVEGVGRAANCNEAGRADNVAKHGDEQGFQALVPEVQC